MINSSEEPEVEEIKEFNLRQMIHMLVDEINTIKTQLSEIEDTLVQMNNGN